MNYSDLMSVVNGSVKCAFGTFVVATTTVRMNKRNNPYYERFQKVTLVKNPQLGADFESTVNRSLAKQGEATDYVVSPNKGFEWLEYPYTKKAIKSGLSYLVINFEAKKRHEMFETRYLLDGQAIAKDAAIEIINAHGGKEGIKSTFSVKQASYGLVKEEEQRTRVQYATDNILYIGHSLEKARKVFNK